ncbi:MAG: hypothetical protein R3253_17350 [Longimicrobiales bacterium]|nr:hypothetical protein [Longimicrobiales bacterium]
MSAGVWGDVGLGVGDSAEYTFGHLRLRLRRRAEELWLNASHDEEGVAETPGASGLQRDVSFDDVAPESWLRWAVPAEESLALHPALPDRLVVVSPEQPFHLPPEGRAKVFVRIPLFVRVRTTGEVSSEATLEEFPSLVLSDTWWGTFTEGELGYWLETRARRQIGPELYQQHLAICPFVLVNRSDSPLPVERFAVRVAYLTLFGRSGAVWTDEVQVRYRGGPEGSEIRYTGKVPDDAGDVELMAKSREPAPRGFHARTFGRLKAKVAML